MLTSVDRLLRGWDKGLRRCRGMCWSFRVRVMGGRVGARLEVDRHARLRWPAHSNIRIGSDVYIGIGAVIDAPRGARLEVGDHVKLMHYTVVAASESVAIGSWSQIAEFSSVRDSDHGIARGVPIQLQSVSTPTFVGEDVWIGRGVAVLRGSRIQDGAVIGANAVVRGTIGENSIAVGIPAVVRKTRDGQESASS